MAFLSEMQDLVDYVVDVNPHKHDKFIAGTGHEVHSPKQLTTEVADLIVAMNSVYLSEIRADLAMMGVETSVVGL